jgi:hypothetical protein
MVFMARHRKVTPSPEEVIEIGKELVEWAKVEDKDNPRLMFAEFYSGVKHILRREWKALLKLDEFAPYYEQAQQILAKRCIDGTMEKSFGHRFLRLYNREVVDAENEEKAYNYQLKRKEEEESQDSMAKKLVDAIKEIDGKEPESS